MQRCNYQVAADFLAGLGEDWAELIDKVGPCSLEVHMSREPYESLIRAVAFQQLHPKAGDAILGRLLNLQAQQFPSPQQLLIIKYDALRICGFSARKIETLYAIAHASLNGLVPSRVEAESMSNEALITRLVTIKGIGPWTVEMMLIFSLARMDVLPADDFGIAEGYKRLKGLAEAPKPKQLREIGKLWSPYRSIASWYLWRVPK